VAILAQDWCTFFALIVIALKTAQLSLLVAVFGALLKVQAQIVAGA
jgi:hypothetical protein